MLPVAEAIQPDGRDRGLARRRAGRRAFHAVVDGVADHVQQRLEQGLDHHLVGFGGVALDDEARGFAETCRRLAHQAREALEDLAEGQHPDGQDGPLQLGGQALQLAVLILQHQRQRLGLTAALGEARGVPDGVLDHDQFAGELHEGVDAADLNPQGARRGFDGLRRPRVVRRGRGGSAEQGGERGGESGRVGGRQAAGDGVFDLAGLRRQAGMAQDIGRDPASRPHPAGEALVPASVDQRQLRFQHHDGALRNGARSLQSRQGEQADLVGRRLQEGGDLVHGSVRQGLDQQVTGEGVHLVQRRPRFARLHAQGQKAGRPGDQRQRILASEKAVGVGRIEDGDAGRRAVWRGGDKLIRPGRSACRGRGGTCVGPHRGLRQGESGDELGRRRICVQRSGFCGFHHRQPADDLVEAGQAVAHQVGGDGMVAPADGGQHVLGGVHGAGHGVELDDAGGPFQGVEGAEGAVEAGAVVGGLFQRQEVVGGLLHQFARLDQELFEELVHAGWPHSMRT